MEQEIPTHTERLLSSSHESPIEVKIGDIAIGGESQVSVQSMLTSSTLDTESCVQQCIDLIEAGCEIIRITAQNIHEAKGLKEIKSALSERKYNIPLVADIHYTPNAAVVAAEIVDKIRINPGNFVKRKNLSKSDELKLIKNKLKPIIEACRKHKTAIRIGVNHGSLSERIMQDFGDSALGMVESALEYIQICEDLDFDKLIISLKASNVKTMLRANRLMYQKMLENNKLFPLHLGVTEAGNGNDGRIKSSVGIASLLLDGIGNTIRVSLTEKPEAEISVAKFIRDRYTINTTPDPGLKSIFTFSSKRKTSNIQNIGSENKPVVLADFSHFNTIGFEEFSSVGYNYMDQQQVWIKDDHACDFVYLGNKTPVCPIPDGLGIISDYSSSSGFSENHFPLFTIENLKESTQFPTLNFLKIDVKKFDIRELSNNMLGKSSVLVLESHYPPKIHEERKIFQSLIQNGINNPVILKNNYSNLKEEEYLVCASADFGSLLIDGLGNGLWPTAEHIGPKIQNSIAFGILQATGDRITKTEYVSCPSCGRAKFDVQETKNKIEAVTEHLKGIKIGVMGCIVNGPGEMADADYGYVGSGKGKVTLYKNKAVIRKDVPEAIATDVLVELLKENGDWVENNKSETARIKLQEQERRSKRLKQH